MAASGSISGLYRSPFLRIILLVLFGLFVVGILFTNRERIRESRFVEFDLPPAHSSTDPLDTPEIPGKIIGLVFYGRKEFVSILDCYLQRNLVENGGLLDEVIFAVNTETQEDLAYLDELVAVNPKYRTYAAHNEDYEYGGWEGSWSVVEHGNIYIKIDDDVVFFEDDAIERIIARMIENPNYLAVSANIINNPALSWVHYSMGAYEPYFPEMKRPENAPAVTWRSSELPFWEGPENFTFDGNQPAPYPGHRWLPIYGDFDINRTPAKDLSYDWRGEGLNSWAAAAQTHYSFLSHLEKQDTHRYKFDLWDYHYYRISINFFGVRGTDIIEAFPFPSDDEDYLTTTRSKDLGRHIVVEGSGLAVHFAFGPQREAHDKKGLFDTDLLSRYRAYAEEMVCPFPNRNPKHKEAGWIGGRKGS